MIEINGKKYEKTINLALQGGGAHGAFTWGVLDRILEDERIFITAVSGTSAGAMNAVVMADGLHRTGTKKGARQALNRFWRAVSLIGNFSPVRRTFWDMLFGNWNLNRSPGYRYYGAINQVLSPYQRNPLNINFLREVLNRLVDFERVRACNSLLVYVSATNVETGRVKVFDRKSLTADMVLASACLPTVFQAVEIDGVPYWDGGFVGNPVLFPFYNESPSDDILIVQINPIVRKGTPRTAHEIQNRMNEINFNSSLMHELRSIWFVRRLIEDDRLSMKSYRKLNMHILGGMHELSDLDASSKLNTEWLFFKHLFRIGRETADNWLQEHYESINNNSSVDLQELLNNPNYLEDRLSLV